jgi:hypothetical protein
MLALLALTLPCPTTSCRVHAWIGFGMVGGWLLFLLWGGVQYLLSRRGEPGRWFWHLLAGLQVLLVLQLIGGVILLAMGRPLPGLLHLAYGAVFPAVVLVVAHGIGRGLEDPGDAWKVFTLAAFFIFGLTLRALTTGLGLP